MAISWTDGVKSAGTLTIYKGHLSGKWTTVVDAALDAFKRLSQQYGLGVKFIIAKDADSANVIIQSSEGTASFSYGNDTYSQAFNGKALKGKTFLVNPGSGVEKAYTFLPGQPLINTPSGQRGLGAGAMKVIAVHELIHACGLENSDHNNEDLFYGNPTANSGNSPNEDTLMLLNRTGKYVQFPPLFLNSATVGKIKSLW